MDQTRAGTVNSVSYLSVLWRQKVLVGALAVLGLLAGYFFAARQDDVYAASAEILLVTGASSDPFGEAEGQSVDSERILNNAVAQLRSGPLSNEVDAALDGQPLEGGVALSQAPGQLLPSGVPATDAVGGREPTPAGSALVGGISVSAGDRSDVLRVRVESRDPVVAGNAANLLVDAFRRRRAEADRAALTSAQSSLAQQLADLQAEIDLVDEQLTDEGNSFEPNTGLINSLSSRGQLLRSQYTEYQRELDSIEFQLQALTGGVEVLDRAGIPSSPIRPTPLRDGLVGALAGLVVGVAIGFLRIERNRGIASPEQVQEVSGLSVLTVVPRLRQLANRGRRLANPEAMSPFVEAFSTLRTTLQFSSMDRERSTFLVTGSVPGEGKSTVVANLAAAYSRAGVTVTVVSCDLRRPTVHTFFDVEDTVGFTDVLVGAVTVEQAVHHVEIPGGLPIRLLTAGTSLPNPSEALGTDRAARLLAHLSASSDVTLIDSAPVMPVNDAVVLSRRVDGVLLVCSEGQTELRDLLTTTNRLKQVGGMIIGVVYNRSRHHGGQSYQYGRQQPTRRRGRTSSSGGRRARVDAR